MKNFSTIIVFLLIAAFSSNVIAATPNGATTKPTTKPVDNNAITSEQVFNIIKDIKNQVQVREGLGKIFGKTITVTGTFSQVTQNPDGSYNYTLDYKTVNYVLKITSSTKNAYRVGAKATLTGPINSVMVDNVRIDNTTKGIKIVPGVPPEIKLFIKTIE